MSLCRDWGYPFARIVVFLLVLLSMSSCESDKRQTKYNVIGRTNSDEQLIITVPVVLQHDGHKYYARCNNIKAVENPKVTVHCNLHVGDTVECQFFTSRDISGYDLICGSKRNEKGDLDTYGENELLFIDREEY